MTGHLSSVVGNLSKSKYGLAYGISHDCVKAEDNEVGIVNVAEVEVHGTSMVLPVQVVEPILPELIVSDHLPSH